MDKTLFNVVYNRKKKLLANGTALIQIEAYLRCKKKYFSTNIYITKDFWDDKHRLIKSHHTNAIRLNKQIADFIAKLEKIELDRRNAGKPFTLDILSNFLEGRFTQSFTDFMAKEIEQSKLAPATRTGHLTTLNTLKDFKKEVLFDEFTFEFLSDFERYLYNKKLGINTINKYFRHLRRYINLAINKDLFDLNRYPFRKFKAKTETTTRDYLSPEELEAIENIKLEVENAHLQKVIDMFLFSCFTNLVEKMRKEEKEGNRLIVRNECLLMSVNA